MVLLFYLDAGLQFIEVILLSSVKFIFGPALSTLHGFNYITTVLYTTLGGVAGVAFFLFGGQWIFRRLLKKSSRRLGGFFKEGKLARNIRMRYGFMGIIILTPVLLSIPLGSLLAARYYAHRKGLVLWMSGSVILWSFILSTLTLIF